MIPLYSFSFFWSPMRPTSTHGFRIHQPELVGTYKRQLARVHQSQSGKEYGRHDNVFFAILLREAQLKLPSNAADFSHLHASTWCLKVAVKQMDKASMPKRGVTWSASGQAENKGEGCLTGISCWYYVDEFVYNSWYQRGDPARGGKCLWEMLRNFKVDFLEFEEGCLKMIAVNTLERLIFWSRFEICYVYRKTIVEEMALRGFGLNWFILRRSMFQHT